MSSRDVPAGGTSLAFTSCFGFQRLFAFAMPQHVIHLTASEIAGIQSLYKSLAISYETFTLSCNNIVKTSELRKLQV